MADSRLLSDAIELIYALALDENLWPTVLEHINDLIGGDGTFYLRASFAGQFIIDDVRDQGAIRGNWDNYADVGHHDPKIPILLKLPRLRVISDYDFIAEHEIDRHPFYQRLLIPHNLRYMVGANLSLSSKEHVFLAVHRAPDRGHVQRREIELMDEVARHVSQATEIGRRLHRSDTVESSLRAALDQLPDAIFILESDATIIDANQRAEAMLRDSPTLRSWRSTLVTDRPTSTKALHDLIASAAKQAPGQQAGQAQPIHQDGFEVRPLMALASPLPRRETPILLHNMAGKPMVILVISDPNDKPPAFPERLAKLFGFTPAEARMASALAMGASVNEYAEQANISLNTARWTLKRMQAKADCRRQGEMIRVFSALAATAAVTCD